jgi:site-specific DNA-methyltransferase (adenine-specific)
MTELGGSIVDKWLNQIIQGDCLEVMRDIPDKSVDLILCDLPYGTTQCKWDTIIPFETLWEQYGRIIKDNGAIVLTASQPFTSKLVVSNLSMFHHDWCWKKSKVTGVLNAKKQPLRTKEDILVFAKHTPTYNPQGLEVCNKQTGTGVSKKGIQGEATGKITQTDTGTYTQTYTNYPRNVLEIASEGKTIHPTQKPVALFEYLIKTYTNEGEIVLDNCIGSGTTAIAALNTGRFFIGIEKEPQYCEIARKRVQAAQEQQALFG